MFSYFQFIRINIFQLDLYEKTRRYLSERLYETAIKKKSKKSKLGEGFRTEKPTESLISSFTTNYVKKQRNKELYQNKIKSTQITFTKTDLSEDLKNQIKEIIRREYFYRFEIPENFFETYFHISEITSQIERGLKINHREFYILLKELTSKDIKLTLIDNPEENEDKKIKFFPFIDEAMCYSSSSFIPKEYSNFKISVIKNFMKSLKVNKEKRITSN